MAKLEYWCMAVVFVLGIFSLVVNFQDGFLAWCWQFNLLIWVAMAYSYRRRLDKYES